MLIPVYGNDEDGNEILLDILEYDDEEEIQEDDEVFQEDYDFFNDDFLLEY